MALGRMDPLNTLFLGVHLVLALRTRFKSASASLTTKSCAFEGGFETIQGPPSPFWLSAVTVES